MAWDKDTKEHILRGFLDSGIQIDFLWNLRGDEMFKFKDKGNSCPIPENPVRVFEWTRKMNSIKAGTWRDEKMPVNV